MDLYETKRIGGDAKESYVRRRQRDRRVTVIMLGEARWYQDGCDSTETVNIHAS